MSAPTLSPAELILSDRAADYAYNADIPPYPASEYDFDYPSHRPLFLVEADELSPMELGPTSVQCLYFLTHPAVNALAPFLRIPDRIPRTDPLYLVALLNRAQLAFVSDLFITYLGPVHDFLGLFFHRLEVEKAQAGQHRPPSREFNFPPRRFVACRPYQPRLATNFPKG
jgi:hypothetical protein